MNGKGRGGRIQSTSPPFLIVLDNTNVREEEMERCVTDVGRKGMRVRCVEVVMRGRVL